MISDVDFKSINKALEHLIINNCLIELAYKPLDEKPILTEKWMGGKYTISKIPEKLMNRWDDVQIAIENGTTMDSNLPKNIGNILENSGTRY